MTILSRAILQPPLFQARLRLAQLRDVCADLKEHAEILRITPSVTVRTSARLDLGIELDQACKALAGRDLAAVQVHYRYDGRTWCDSYLGCPYGVRMIRQVLPGTLRVVPMNTAAAPPRPAVKAALATAIAAPTEKTPAAAGAEAVPSA